MFLQSHLKHLGDCKKCISKSRDKVNFSSKTRNYVVSMLTTSIKRIYFSYHPSPDSSKFKSSISAIICHVKKDFLEESVSKHIYNYTPLVVYQLTLVSKKIPSNGSFLKTHTCSTAQEQKSSSIS
jgi:hypothetical protein